MALGWICHCESLASNIILLADYYQLLSVMLEKHGGIDAPLSHELGNQMAVPVIGTAVC
jgi:hypothetical protein